MAIKPVSSRVSTAKPSARGGAAAVRKPFDQTRKMLDDDKIDAALRSMKGKRPEQLAAAIKAQLPTLARPLKRMIQLLDRPKTVLAAFPHRADAERVALAGWGMLRELIDRTDPALPPAETMPGTATAAHLQLVNLFKSEMVS